MIQMVLKSVKLKITEKRSDTMRIGLHHRRDDVEEPLDGVSAVEPRALEDLVGIAVNPARMTIAVNGNPRQTFTTMRQSSPNSCSPRKLMISRPEDPQWTEAPVDDAVGRVEDPQPTLGAQRDGNDPGNDKEGPRRMRRPPNLRFSIERAGDADEKLQELGGRSCT